MILWFVEMHTYVLSSILFVQLSSESLFELSRRPKHKEQGLGEKYESTMGPLTSEHRCEISLVLLVNPWWPTASVCGLSQGTSLPGNTL